MSRLSYFSLFIFVILSNAKDLFLIAGFRPCRRPPFVSAKGGKTILARARNNGELVHRHESGWRGNSLQGARPPCRSDSPRREVGFGAAALPRPRQERTRKRKEKKFILNDPS